MASVESSGINLTSDFFMKNFYKFNRNAFKTSTRKDYNEKELSFEDSRALKRAAQKLLSFDYEEEENGDNIVSTIEAFAETYNNALSSTSCDDADTYRQNRQLKALSEKYADDLEDIGITIEEDGSFSVSENVLKSSSFEDVKKVFSKESDYMNKLKTIARRMHTTSHDEIYAQMTGAGTKFNIVL
uniref:hypothetical protein n=1 Tax=Agathobacter sp. TaxID=2021311 RepID=UPI004056A094